MVKYTDTGFILGAEKKQGLVRLLSSRMWETEMPIKFLQNNILECAHLKG